VIAVSEFFKHNKSIQKINTICHNNVAFKGATKIAKVIQINTALQALIVVFLMMEQLSFVSLIKAKKNTICVCENL